MIVIIGIIGSIISFVLMKTKMFRNKSYSQFLCALSVFDSLCLIYRQKTLIHEHLQDKSQDGVFTYYNDISCRIYNFYEHVCYLMSSWLIVGMAAERVVAMCLPFRKTLMRTQTGAIIIIMCIFIIMCLSQVFRFFMVKNIGERCQEDIYEHIQYINIQKYRYAKYIDMYNFFLTKMSMDRANVIGMIINNMLFKYLNKNRRLKI